MSDEAGDAGDRDVDPFPLRHDPLEVGGELRIGEGPVVIAPQQDLAAMEPGHMGENLLRRRLLVEDVAVDIDEIVRRHGGVVVGDERVDVFRNRPEGALHEFEAFFTDVPISRQKGFHRLPVEGSGGLRCGGESGRSIRRSRRRR